MTLRIPLVILSIFLITLTTLTPASSSCWVSADCETANPISCSGEVCTSGPGWIDCDGNYRTCPNCSQTDGICNAGSGLCDYDLDCCPQDGYCGPECNSPMDPDC